MMLLQEREALESNPFSPLNGWIIVDKPEGMTSMQAVARIKRLFKVKKAGHGGTLDPLASGVLPIALGEATKTLSYVLEGKKAYRFEVKWGEATSTEDREGEITALSSHRPSEADILRTLVCFRGEIEQIPPLYSALKIGGKRAYALARQGKEVKLAPRKVIIEELELLKIFPDSAVFEVTCSKGTYVRSLGRDLALKLGTYGHLINLRRLRANSFHEKDAILLDSLLEIGHNSKLLDYVLPLQDALADILALEVGDKEVLRLRQGQLLSFPYEKERVVLVTCAGVPQALARAGEGTLKPLRVFNIN